MNYTELIEQVRLGLGNPSASKYTDAQILTNLNKWQKIAGQTAIEANGQWEVDGEIATTDIIAGQKEYALTTDIPLMSLKRVEINLTGETNNWVVANIKDLRNMYNAISNADNGYSEYELDVYSNSLFFTVEPSLTVINGLKIFYQKQAMDMRANEHSVTLEEAEGKIITINGLDANKSIQLVQNTSDTLEIVSVGDLLTIKLANTTPINNDIALIQAGVRTIFADATCSGDNWSDITGATITKGSMITEASVHNEPFLPESCQMYLVYGAIYDYAFGYGLDEKRTEAGLKLKEYDQKILDFYGQRLPASPVRKTNKVINYR